MHLFSLNSGAPGDSLNLWTKQLPERPVPQVPWAVPLGSLANRRPPSGWRAADGADAAGPAQRCPRGAGWCPREPAPSVPQEQASVQRVTLAEVATHRKRINAALLQSPHSLDRRCVINPISRTKKPRLREGRQPAWERPACASAGSWTTACPEAERVHLAETQVLGQRLCFEVGTPVAGSKGFGKTAHFTTVTC